MVAASRKKSRRPYPEFLDLTVDELQLLVECPYEEPGHVTSDEQPFADKLVKLGLFEKNPCAGNQYRCTEAGMRQATPLTGPHVVKLLEQGVSLELIQRRFLVEQALHGSRVASALLGIAS